MADDFEVLHREFHMHADGSETLVRAVIRTPGIYDRSRWPEPAANPLIVLLERDAEWYTNKEVVAALGADGSRKSIFAQWPSLAQQLGDEHTAIISRGLLVPTAERQGRQGGQERCFSKKALIIIGMRAQTVNAAAFRDWIADGLAADIRLDQISW